MATVTILLRFILACVFLIASSAKTYDHERWTNSLSDFGVPAGLTRPIGWLLIAIEFATASALLFKTTEWWGSISALALFITFDIVISLNLLRGRRPLCHCFGSLNARSVGWSTVVRNGAFAIMAALLIVWGSHYPAASVWSWAESVFHIWSKDLWIILTVLFAVIALLAWLQINLVRQNGRILLRLDDLESVLAILQAQPSVVSDTINVKGLPVGSPAPNFSVEDIMGSDITLKDLLAIGKPIFIVFSDPNCGPCRDLLPDLRIWSRRHGSKLTFALVTREGSGFLSLEATLHVDMLVLAQEGTSVSQAYRCPGTPAAVLIGLDGAIATPISIGAIAIA